MVSIRDGFEPFRSENCFIIWEFCRFPLPCFATGCHAYNFKIATAALRPRNDTNLNRFHFGNGRFS